MVGRAVNGRSGRVASCSGREPVSPGYSAETFVTTVERYLEAGYALVVAAAAMIYPPAALVVAAVFLIALAVVADRREVKS